ncbi:cysteine hydrolase family protein [Dictyobacter kobayashii]|uniref:Hydrolase n=1 Tax=Dictyobacter kobayashii TaxID=2014872 RepID=A0A402AV40_9CHLR|nr:isochorismatase family cysteine hydrolase [Dictyobacter kobayashii]GCE22929.1 hydrolase [Dictyobacter kobayashii]
MTKNFSEQEVLTFARLAYREGSATFGVERDHCALLVIDMQDEFVRPHSTPFWVPEATRLVPRIKQLIEACRTKSVPVIYTAFARTHQYLDRPLSGPLMPNRYTEEDAAWFRDGTIWHELAPLENEIVLYKPSYGAFYDTPLETILKNLHKDTVIICGTLTNFCCGTTARQAYERGFKVIIGGDITATDDPAMQEPELQVLRKGFAKVLSLSEILEDLAG